MVDRHLAARAVRVAVTLAVAALTLAAPVCPVQADGGHECCCAHEEPHGVPQHAIDEPACSCASPDQTAHPSFNPAAAVTSCATDVPAAVATPCLQVPRVVHAATPLVRAAARPPPPRLFHIETVVLRR